MKKQKPYQSRTLKKCMAYLKEPTQERKESLIRCLERWATSEHQLPEYDYGDIGLAGAIEYCSDRMNSGRAKGILTLFKMEG